MHMVLNKPRTFERRVCEPLSPVHWGQLPLSMPSGPVVREMTSY